MLREWKRTAEERAFAAIASAPDCLDRAAKITVELDDADRELIRGLGLPSQDDIEALTLRLRSAAKTDIQAFKGVRVWPLHSISLNLRTQDSDNEIAFQELFSCDSFTGTATALTRVGIIKENMLPGQPNRGKRIAVVDGPEGGRWAVGYIEITRIDARLFEATVGITSEESERRQQVRDRLLQADQAAKRFALAQQREALELSELPRSHQQYRESCEKTLKAHLNIARDTAIAANNFSGYCFDNDTLRAFDKAAIELLKTLYRGSTIFNPAAQERRNIEIKSQSSKVNIPLQSFLQSVSARTDGAEESAS